MPILNNFCGDLLNLELLNIDQYINYNLLKSFLSKCKIIAKI